MDSSPHEPLAADDSAWVGHEARAGALVAEVLRPVPERSWGRSYAQADEWLERLHASPPEVVGSALVLLVRASAEQQLPWTLRLRFTGISRRAWSVERADAFLALEAVSGVSRRWHDGWGIKVAENLLRRTVDGPLTAGEASVVRAALAALDDKSGSMATDARRETRARLARLLPAMTDGVDTAPLHPGDAWAVVVLPELVTTTHPAEVGELLRLLADATGSKPSQGWLAGVRTLLDDEEPGHELRRVLRLLVEGLATAGPVPAPDRPGGYLLLVDDRNVDVARAAVWASLAVPGPWVVPTLHRVAVRGIRPRDLTEWMSGDKVPNAALVALGRIATAEAVAALQQLAGTTRHNGFRKRIAAAQAAAAESAGLTPSQLVERTVPTGGLDQHGAVSLTSGEVTARALLDDALRVALEWGTADGWTARPPAGADAAEVNRVKRAVKELKDLVAGERRRLEALLAADRRWEPADWRRHYLDHLVTGRIARRLLWVFDVDGTRVTGLPLDAGTVRTPDGEVTIDGAGGVRLWHPATAGTHEVAAWREWLLRAELVQPFKQAFREVYLLTPAELTTATHSHRFAAHVLHYQQLYALFKERGWAANYLGNHQGGYDGRARREFADAGLTAVFEHQQVEEPDAFRAELCTTDRVWFFATADRSRRPVQLDSVPPLVLSEAMRDVDLFVGVTSIALDPTWADRGGDPHREYWLGASFGPLNATAQVRRDVLARLLPMLGLGDAVELGDRHVRVRGTRATYQVHLGSGNVRVEPDDRYLCIVPAGHGRAKRVMLPFEGDDVLAVILSKVLLLAADHKITDPTILRQLEPRR